MTKNVGIIGYPLSHSISPSFQQAAIDHFGLDVEYHAWPTPPDSVVSRIASLRGEDVLGANVTVPHKEAALELMDDVDEQAATIGAVNTIVNRGGRLMGHNTDAYGLITALGAEAGADLAGRTVLVLGAGGAARAAVFGLAQEQVARILIANRTAVRAAELVEDVKKASTSASAVAWERSELARAVANSAVVINCTSVGMAHGGTEGRSPLPTELLRPGLLVFDMVYNPAMTPLLREAEASDATPVGGLAMLVHQGAAAFELWTGKQAPVDVMSEAARRAMAAMDQ